MRGYASPEGVREVNGRIVRRHTEAVKDVLTGRCGILGGRITAGDRCTCGAEDPDRDRVSVRTVNTGL